MKLDKSRQQISRMFDDIAPKYDFLNHLFTLNRDKKWRREIIKYLKKLNRDFKYVLDIASGTGDLTLELFNLNPFKVFSIDISEKMLDVQKKKIKSEKLFIELADVHSLSNETGSLDLATIGFGIRNFDDMEKSLKEIHRVLNKDGLLVVLEMFSRKKKDAFYIYFSRLMPKLGNRISKSSHAYNYLFNSVNSFYNVNDFSEIVEKTGFKCIHIKNNFLGIVHTVYFQKC
ncbi:MAG: ubiquinone/menaquinone biosynthesis methyltransferase [Ignavibacteriae bacterium]|nr:ubiquinone/menaquinone biosynthesis methyltransferase [Ignavibacteriota bacterium]